MLSESQLAMLREEVLVAIGCNISSPRLIDVAFLGACAEGSVKTAQGLKSQPFFMLAPGSIQHSTREHHALTMLGRDSQISRHLH